MPSYKAAEKMSLTTAQALADKFISLINVGLGITHSEISGSIRRKEPWVGDIDLIVEGASGVLTGIRNLPSIAFKEGGDERITVVYEGQQVNVFRAEQSYWGAMMLYLSGPTGATIAYRQKAIKKNMTLNQLGLFDKDGKKIAGETEEGIFQALGHTMKPPELRGKKR